MQALEVKSIGETEQTLLSYQQGYTEAKHVTKKQWEKIAEHDRILNAEQ